ncbi:hypothetical protein COV56_01635 [Candidatus Kuenenbacteria bacterium CG11_big_fil_rev_8_21_14_0_20_37_9]|uniref:Zinc/iron-chelating domain-containing protein n=1 Tax=Candidatus Kuenenbacteria bacterium CG08_land_8_20_14_0_20_37_23 TaxID=1974617 RepID=A0A2M6XSL7_9BACT|nr:MAG: hypothetical protein COV56_01635 [Candidatus Kuenenbacteria bacterium CG11_big_fil_rev_8_21_14_0_20_37_9]PIU10634.1 MAG: hypothetical protein COT27_02075 [Candidatus Kuenenbacteria bacterium CG08_land_8_20_14_0_20_37_23]
MSNFCSECAKRKEDCCRSDYIKFITLKDAVRIAKSLNAPIKKIIIYGKLSAKDKKTKLYIKKIHNYYYDLASRDEKILQLKRKKDGSCFFLSKMGHCTIYKVRPLICQVFPFWYAANGEIIIDHNGMDCDIVKNKTTYNQKIKRFYEVEIFKNFSQNKLGLKKLLIKLKKEIAIYQKNIDNFITTNNIKNQ